MFLVRLGSNAAGFVLCARILLGAKGPRAVVAASGSPCMASLGPGDGTPENSEAWQLVGLMGTPWLGVSCPALEMPMESRERLVVR